MYNNWAECFAMRTAFLITRKDVGILNDKFSVPQCASSSRQWQDAVYQVGLGKGSGSVCVSNCLFMMKSCGVQEFFHSTIQRLREKQTQVVPPTVSGLK